MTRNVLTRGRSKPIPQPALRRSSNWGVFLKTAGDYLFASIALIVFFPSMLVISILIKLDSRGPVFVRQRYWGADGKIIAVLQFRTIPVPENSEETMPLGRMEKRVTRVGRFLRQTRLDELPMLFNVLTGDLSIVGPRPLPEGLGPRYQKIKPGIVWWRELGDFGRI